MTEPDRVDRSLASLVRYLDETGWSGYDPYDALNSPYLAALSAHSKTLRIAFTQALKLSPVNFRPLLGVPKGINPKGLGLFLAGYLKLHAMTKEIKWLEAVRAILALLEQTRSKGYSGYCWGYHFDWQSRAGFTPKYTPTIVNTVFVAHAYLDAYALLGDEAYLDVALSAADFILTDLHVHRDGDSICFSYTPFDRTKVYNASILGSGLLSRLFAVTGDKRYLAPAKASARFVVERQQPDGSWTYADSSFQKWVDSHHTGFVLEALFNYIIYSGDAEYIETLKRGLDYYTRHFFLDDGHPMFYSDKHYPVDIHCPSQALITFSRLHAIENNKTMCGKVARWMIENLQDAKGYFYYRIGRVHTNKIPYARWSQAWAFHALTTYKTYALQSRSL
jgi:rhamnogalacturonyl hydrolase YesR